MDFRGWLVTSSNNLRDEVYHDPGLMTWQGQQGLSSFALPIAFSASSLHEPSTHPAAKHVVRATHHLLIPIPPGNVAENINETAVWTRGKHSQSSAPTPHHLASMSARQSSVSTNVHPGSSGNVRLLLLPCEQTGPTRIGNHRPHVATAIRRDSTTPIPTSRPRDALARFEAGLAPPSSFTR